MPFDFSSIEGVEIKAPIPADAIPQERITGDVLRGYGPRRGNLERLLRYWRPIMRKPGGFRRCRVILADHPELYPLNNICAWLHHETTGLWPNEGCHHPGMKNCRRKLRNVVRGSIISDSDFESRMRRIAGRNTEKSLSDGEDSPINVVTEADFKHAIEVLRDFIVMEPRFINSLREDGNWLHEGDDDSGSPVEHEWVKSPGSDDCNCG